MSRTIKFCFAIIALIAVCKCSPINRSNEDTTAIAVIDAGEVGEVASSTTAIDTLSEVDEHGVRVKRQGGCGCCCCRPCCCQCCRCCCCRCCCCCCRCCCCRCCCCRPCCCCGGCGCCGCGGGRKRRALQNLKVKLANKMEQEAKMFAATEMPALPEAAQVTVTEENVETKVDETGSTDKQVNSNKEHELPEPVYELGTDDKKNL